METTLQVEGMTCAHCEASVKEALENLAGVERVKINLDSGEVNITYDESTIEVEKMKEAIESQGYDVV